MQQNNYIEAEDAYRRALLISPDNNKMCNLGICLMKQGRISEAKETLRRVKPAVLDGPRGVDSHLKAYERAQQMLLDLESEMMKKGGDDRVEQSKLFDILLGSSSIWQPQPCREHTSSNSSFKPQCEFADENVNSNIMPNPPVGFPVQKSVKSLVFPQGNNNYYNSLNIDAPPFYSSKFVKDPVESQFHETLKRTRSGNAANSMRTKEMGELWKPFVEGPENKTRRKSISPEEKKARERWEEVLPDSKDFEEAILAAVLGSGNETEKVVEMSNKTGIVQRKIDKRLRVFQDITLSLSPRA